MKEKIKKYYMVVTKDEYELPLFISDSRRETSKFMGITPRAVTKALWYGQKNIRRVYIDDEED